MKRALALWFLPAILLCANLHAANETPLLKPGTHEGSLQHDKLERTYLLHLPPDYDGAKPLPLVLFFHGGFGTAKHAAEHYGWNEKADAEGFIVVYANGTGTFQTWNAAHGCGSAFRNKIDDVGFVKALVNALQSKLKIDPKRIYATGMSNGAMLSHRLGAELPQLFAAIAPVAGAIGGKENPTATEKRIPDPASPVATIIVHGKADKNVRYEGGQSSGVERNRVDLSVADAVAFWVKANRCAAAPQKEELSGGSVLKEFYASDSGADVVLYSVVNGGHAWPGGKKTRPRAGYDEANQSMNATDTIWEFFKNHPKE